MRSQKMRLVVASLIMASLTGCGAQTAPNPQSQVEQRTEVPATEVAQTSALDFNLDSYTTQTMTVEGQEVVYRAYEQMVYVENPVEPQYQCMNIYIPEAYFNGESLGGFTAETAPIFLPNNVGGYMPAEPGTPALSGGIDGEASRMGMTNNDGAQVETPNSLLLALSKGYVVASPGARGRTLQDANGTYTGKAPSGIVDLKAAVRYLHYNDGVMPGNAEKIISNGTSAGGAMSSLLGATGDSTDYEPYLEALGAAKASDAIYAVSAYCPITNLNHADMAYEWLLNGFNEYTKMNISKDENGQIKRERVSLTMTEEQQAYSDELKAEFPAYVNSLNLKDEQGKALTLDESGNGSFKDYLKTYIIASVQSAVDAGEDTTSLTWATIQEGKVTDIDFEGYVAYLSRSKAAPAFDSVDLSAAENNLFGTENMDSQHFTAFGLANDTVGGTLADEKVIKMMNPMNYIGTGQATVAEHWRIRHGIKDSDTAMAIPTILALTLEANGVDVDFTVPWGQGHGGDYDLNELFAWMASII